MALHAIGCESPAAPLALPAYSCYDVATAAVGADVPVILYDLEPRTLTPDLDSLRDAVDDGAVAVVVTHLYGIPVDMDPVLELTRQAGTLLVEDAAQAAGALYRDRPLGGFGDLSVLSFGRGKGTTGCGGGALLANSEKGESLVRRLEGGIYRSGFHGCGQMFGLLAQWLLGRPELYDLPASIPFLELGDTVYREPRFPRGMSALSAGTLNVTLEAAKRERVARQRRARRLRDLVRAERGLRQPEAPAASTPGYLRLPILAQEELHEVLTSKEAVYLGIMPGYPKQLSELDAMKDRCINGSRSRPGTQSLIRQLYTLPTHSMVKDCDMNRLSRFFRKVGRKLEAETTV